ncbi:oxidative DNA demethylase [Terramyces sp. JEL0728]|nr:oxidative DNA demethylase [Terramyces sp. JEL0728]
MADLQSRNLEAFSQQELRDRLLDQFNKAGLREKLKSQLRSKLFAELSFRTKVTNNQPSPTSVLLVKVVDSLFTEYLSERGLEFTLSVFLPETGQNLNTTLKQDDIVRALHLDPVKNMINLADSKESLIMRLVRSVSKVTDNPTRDKEVQTNVEIDDILNIKLRDIDHSLRHRKGQYERIQVAQLEERIYTCQRELEEQSAKQLEQQIANFKQVELVKMKLEEKKALQIALDRLKSENEQKMLELETKCMNDLQLERTRMAEREREMDKQNMVLRQKILDESNIKILKESQLRNEVELSAKQVVLERDQLKHRMEDIQQQMKQLAEYKEKYTKQMEETMTEYKVNLTKEYSTLLSTVEVERAKLKGEQLMVDQKEATVDKMLSKIHKTEQDLSETKIELQDVLARLDEAKKAKEDALYQVKDLQLQLLTSKGSISLEFEITSLKKQLLEAERKADVRQQENESLVKGLMTPKTDHAQDLRLARDNEAKWKTQCKDLVEKLDNEMSQNELLNQKLEQEILKNKELSREVADMKVLLHQSQAAFSMAQQRATFAQTKIPIHPNNLRYKNTARDGYKAQYAEPKHQLPLPETYSYNFDFKPSYPEPPTKDSSALFADPIFNKYEREFDHFFKKETSADTKPLDPSLETTSNFGGQEIKSTAPTNKASHQQTPGVSKISRDFSIQNDYLNEKEHIRPLIQEVEPGQEAIKVGKDQLHSQAGAVVVEKQQALDEDGQLKLEVERKLEERAAQERQIAQERQKELERIRIAEQEQIKTIALEKQRAQELEREQEQIKTIAREKQKALELERQQVEKAREIELAKQKEKEEAMKGIKQLENDPLLQKYMALVKDKKGITETKPESKSSTHSDLGIAAGDTADEVR